jgi:hypothetical protein
MRKVIVTLLLVAVIAPDHLWASRVAIDDNLAGGYSVLGGRLWAGGFGEFWSNWWGNATASFGGFSPIPSATPYKRASGNGTSPPRQQN